MERWVHEVLAIVFVAYNAYAIHEAVNSTANIWGRFLEG